MQPTQRSYTDIETGINWRLYMDEITHQYALIYEGKGEPYETVNGTRINGWYLAAHNSIDLKINAKKIIVIPSGSFYNLKEGETATHKRYSGIQKKFSKIKN